MTQNELPRNKARLSCKTCSWVSIENYQCKVINIFCGLKIIEPSKSKVPVVCLILICVSRHSDRCFYFIGVFASPAIARYWQQTSVLTPNTFFRLVAVCIVNIVPLRIQ